VLYVSVLSLHTANMVKWMSMSKYPENYQELLENVHIL